MGTLQYFKVEFKKKISHEKLKKPPSKVAKKNSFFSLLTWAAQTAQTEEFMLQNVAYGPTVYKTGVPVQSWFIAIEANLLP